MINKTWQGYEISKQRKGSRFPVYVKSIYKGEIKWTTDYAHAKHYTEATAKKLDKQIDDDIRAGKHEGILPDGEETLNNMKAVLDKFLKEHEEHTAKGDTKRCRELWDHIEDIKLDIELYTKEMTNAGVIPADSWMEVLEKRVSDLREKKEADKELLKMAVDDFKKWVSNASYLDIAFNAEFKAKEITNCEESYTTTMRELAKASDELLEYHKVTKGLF